MSRRHIYMYVYNSPLMYRRIDPTAHRRPARPMWDGPTMDWSRSRRSREHGREEVRSRREGEKNRRKKEWTWRCAKVKMQVTPLNPVTSCFWMCKRCSDLQRILLSLLLATNSSRLHPLHNETTFHGPRRPVESRRTCCIHPDSMTISLLSLSFSCFSFVFLPFRLPWPFCGFLWLLLLRRFSLLPLIPSGSPSGQHGDRCRFFWASGRG